MQPQKVLVSAGETSGDLYAAALIEALRRHWPTTHWFGCAGERMKRAGVRADVEASELAVVGLIEVVRHLPRIYSLHRRLVRALDTERPDLLLLTDSPDFHLPLARQAAERGIPVIYLVAPQAWAWRSGRVRRMKNTITRLLCLFPFEETFFRERGIRAHYIGHPLARLARPSMSRQEFFMRHQVDPNQPLIALCPGSRLGEIERHLPVLAAAVRQIRARLPCNLILGAPSGLLSCRQGLIFRQRIRRASIQLVEGQTWDLLAHADLALVASGTVTIEAALLGTPMVTFYRVNALSWLLGRPLVKVPYLSMVNLVAGRRLAPELMQNEMTGPRLAAEALTLLEDEKARLRQIEGLREVAAKLATDADPIGKAADIVREFFDAEIGRTIR